MSSTDVFDVVAPDYIRIDEHWGCDLDALKSAFNAALAETAGPVAYLDVGSGPGFHVCAMQEFYPAAEVLGIDPSLEMIEVAALRARVMRLSRVGLLRTPLERMADERFDVVSCLNNTLGNLRARGMRPTAVRERAMRKMRRIVRSDGFLVVSVYNLEKLASTYGCNLRILPKSRPERGDLFVEYRQGEQRVEYYSHWFTENELVELLERNRFKIDLFEKRMSRLVVRARAV